MIAAPGTQRAVSPTLPLSNEPPDTTKIAVNTPKLQAPTTPTEPGAAPTLPIASPAPAAPASAAPSTQPVSRAEPVAASPTPAAPTPYQTNDPLAFMPSSSMVTETAQDLTPSILPTNVSPTGTSGYTPAGAGSQITEGSGFLPSDLTQPTPAAGLNVPAPVTAPIGAGSPINTTQTTPGSALPLGTLSAPVSSITAPTPTPVNVNPNVPGTPLTNSTISVGPTADRFAIANDLLSQWDANSQPQEAAQIKALEQSGAARGQIGSGMMRGALADESDKYQTARTTAQRGFLTDALSGSIEDAYKNAGIQQQQQQFEANQGQQGFQNQLSVAQLQQSAAGQQWAQQLAAAGYNSQQIQQAFENAAQQQGFEASQAQQGFNNNVTLQRLQDSEAGQMWTQQMQAMGFNAQQMQAAFENAYRVQQLSDDETGQAFSRAMQQFVLGSQGSPQSIEEWLAGLYALPQGNGLTV